MGGTTMLDRRGRDELEGALNLGRLADKMVFTIGRLLRSEPLGAEDLTTLERARELFALMTKEDVIVLDRSNDRMLNDESYLDALEVVEVRAGDDAATHAQHYVALLQKALDGDVGDEERDALVAMRELFAEVGEVTLSHAGELSRPRQEPTWRRMRQAISSF